MRRKILLILFFIISTSNGTFAIVGNGKIIGYCSSQGSGVLACELIK